ncbi:MAG: hypothetical protein H6658_08620 [Ardenticatenaceae bacterium]|nr:hypothetical protein [Ardenticatenaceae bacterium]
MSVSLGLVVLLVLAAFVLGVVTTPILVYMRLVRPARMYRMEQMKRQQM